jgi:hypothetical protein
VRDAVRFAEQGLPAVALVTEKFWTQGHYVAKVAGMPEVPRVMLPHPVAGTSRAAMALIADAIADDIVTGLRG